MRAEYQPYLLVSFALGFVGCGRTDLGGALNNGSQGIPSIDACGARWQPITAPRDEPAAKNLNYREGELYYFSETGYTSVQIEAQPVAGGKPRLVAQTSYSGEIWMMADQIYYAAMGNLWRVPISGGTPVQLVIRQFPPGDPIAMIENQTLSPTTFYWQKWYYDDSKTYHDEIWSVPIDGSSPQAFFANMGDFLYLQMQDFSNGLIVAGFDSNIGVTGMVYPHDGSAPRKLARVGYATYTFLGMDEHGIFGFDYATNTQAIAYVAPLSGGSAQPFWPTMPPNFLPIKLWPDGNGNYLISGDEVFNDGMDHKSLFLVDSQGNGTRIACDASREGALDGIDATPAFADDAIYVYNVDRSGVVDNDPSTHTTWQIIKVPRP